MVERGVQTERLSLAIISQCLISIAEELAIMNDKATEQQKTGRWLHKNDDYCDWWVCSECGYGDEGELQFKGDYDVRPCRCPRCDSKNL